MLPSYANKIKETRIKQVSKFTILEVQGILNPTLVVATYDC